MAVNKRQILGSFLWRFFERVGAQGIALVVSIVLARILSPDVYGMVALITAIIIILNVLVDGGFGIALIQKKSADDKDFSTVFWFNIFFCIITYLVLFFLAPFVASFFNNEELSLMIRVLGIGVVISAIKNVQQAYISRNMMFKKFFFATIGGTILSGIIGIVVAVKGYGAWALVWQNISNQFFDTLFLWLFVKWRPILYFSFDRLKVLYRFGWKLLVTALIDTLYMQLRQFVIGKIYLPSDLAYYNQGYKFPSLAVENINSSIDSILLPVLSQEQDNKDRVKQMTRKAIKLSTYFVIPCMFGLIACSKAFVSAVLTEKWLPCVPYITVFSLSFLLYPINTANLNAIKALGRSDISLKLEIIKKSIGFVAIIVTIPFGVLALSASFLFATVLAQFINAFPNKKLLNYGYYEQIKDVIPQLLAAIIMFIVVEMCGFLPLNSIILLILQIVVGIIIYFVMSIILKIDSLYYLLSIIKGEK